LNNGVVGDEYFGGSQAYGTSLDGSVVVFNSTLTTQYGWGVYEEGYLWPSFSTLAHLPFPTSTNGTCWFGPSDNFPRAVNKNGHVAGGSKCWADVWDSSGNYLGLEHISEAVLWQNGTLINVDFTPLNVLTYADSMAYAISEDDWIVGQSNEFSPGGSQGFLRLPDQNCPPQMVGLNTLLDSASAGWTVNAAYGINSHHQIVGQATNPTGQRRAVLLTPDNNLPLCIPN